MRINLATLALVAFVAVGLIAPSANAQRVEAPDQDGTSAALHLTLPVTAHSASVGGAHTAGLATISGVEALHSNPAALTVNGGTSALFSRMEYFADVGVNYFGVAQRLGNNQLALTVSNWDFGDIGRTTFESPELTTDTWRASIVSVAGTYARQFTDRISAGVTARFLSETIDDMDASTVAFDAGMTYRAGESGLRFGVALKNFGPKLEYGGVGLAASIPSNGTAGNAGEFRAAAHELPSLLSFGLAYTRALAGDVSVTGLANFRSNSTEQNSYSAALELGYGGLVYARGGYELRPDMDQTDFQGWSVGGGLNLNAGSLGVTADYAFRPADRLGNVNLFTVGLSL